MHVGRIIAWVFIACGLILVSYNGYMWWTQMSLEEDDPKKARSIDKNWNNRKPIKPLPDVSSSGGQPDITIKERNKPEPSDRIGENVGQLIIPRISAILPIVEGTDDNSLGKGVGKYRGYGTVSPNQTGHVVLSAHRDSFFRKVGELKVGDRLYVRYRGKIYTYQIRKYWVTGAQDRTVIVPFDKPVLTLTTCYPFDYIGSAPDRYIIRSELIQVTNS